MSRIKLIGFDIDFTILDFNRACGLEAAAQKLRPVLTHMDVPTIVHGLNIQSEMMLGKHGQAARYAHAQHIETMFGAHTVAYRGHGLEEVAWSFFSKCAVLVQQHAIEPEAVYPHLVAAEHAFWTGVGKGSAFYPDALNMLMDLELMSVRRFFLTSSDARVMIKQPHKKPFYSIPHARKLKLERFMHSGLFTSPAVISPSEVVVTDPWKKENKHVWNRRVFPRFMGDANPSECAFVGDTIHDIDGAYEAGFGVRILVNRHPGATHSRHTTHVVEQLAEIPGIIAGI